MSKIGVMSMQRIKNYGSFLQAYALKNIIEKLGHDVEFVDYHIELPIINKKTNKILNKYKIFLKILTDQIKIKHKIQFYNHKKNFSRKYNKFLNITDKYNYNPKLDILVIGSDEVFNCTQINPNVGYSLELFGKDNNANKVITYAASFGNTTLKKLKKLKKEKEIAFYLDKIDVISVRDTNSEFIVNKLVNKKVFSNLDPVLIYDYNKDKNFDYNLNIKEKYIIVYAYNDRMSKEEMTIIRKYAHENNYKIYCIGGVQIFADKFIDCKPFEIFGYFKNAEAIITDTFHGTIFSIKCKKKFITLVRKSNNKNYGNEEKLIDLLQKFNLKNRISYDLENINKIINKNINYMLIDKIILRERKKTYKYLKDNIIFNKM